MIESVWRGGMLVTAQAHIPHDVCDNKDGDQLRALDNTKFSGIRWFVRCRKCKKEMEWR